MAQVDTGRGGRRRRQSEEMWKMARPVSFRLSGYCIEVIKTHRHGSARVLGQAQTGVESSKSNFTDA